jgi:hypothetical protein
MKKYMEVSVWTLSQQKLLYMNTASGFRLWGITQDLFFSHLLLPKQNTFYSSGIHHSF